MFDFFGLLFLILVFLLTYGLTKVALIYSLSKGLIDRPGCRTSHKNSMPRGGGISIVITFLISVIALTWSDSLNSFNNAYLSVVVGCSIVAALGFWDDHKHIPAKWRFLVQLFAAFISLMLLPVLPDITFFSMQANLPLLAVPFFVTVLIWSLNLYNFMDGIDGIASIQAITVSISAALILIFNGEIQMAYLLFVLSASVCGFLFWNWPPAMVFMGDACSGFLGFLLGLMAIITSINGAINLWSWLILLAIFVVDATYTLVRRILQGEKCYEAHRSHAYQILSRQYSSHKKITLSVLIVNIFWLFPLAYLSSIHQYWAPVLGLIAILPLIIVVHRAKAGLLND
jgi:Fuc2NAc and GlcNAc transferase